MKYHFDQPNAVSVFQAEIRTWPGTPFHQGGRSKGKGGGTDCVGFVELVLNAVGLLPEMVFQREEQDFSLHVHNDKILNYLRGKRPEPESGFLASIFEELKIDDVVPKSKKWPFFYESRAMPGDLLIIRTGVGQWHMPLMYDNRSFFHCAFPQGVTEGDITAPNYREKTKAIFRARAVPLLIAHPVTAALPT